MTPHLTVKGERLVLVVADVPPALAAAKSAMGWRFVGRSDGCAVFEYPKVPEVARDLVLGLNLAPAGHVADLVAQAVARDALKSRPAQPVDAQLLGESFAHQDAALSFGWGLFELGAKGLGLFMEMGTGKSRVAIGLANALARAGDIHWVLTVAPNSVKGTWAAADGEIVKHSMRPWDRHVLRGARGFRATELGIYCATSIPWVVTNYDQFSVDVADKSFKAFANQIRSMRPGLLILDESTMVKNPRSKRTRTVDALAQLFPRRLILTGAPLAQNPMDFFSQFEILEHGSLGFATYLAFERAYASYQSQHVGGGRQVKVVAGYRNLEDLERRAARLSFRVRAQDVLDLPPVTVQKVDATLSPTQARLYKDLQTQMVGEVQGGIVDGRNVLSRYLRLAQITGGFVGTVDELGAAQGTVPLEQNPKLTALEEYLELALADETAKAVVFANFVPEVEAIVRLGERWGAVPFYGAVKLEDREAGRVRFNTDPECRLMVCQYQCGARGLNLTAANHLVFYSLTFSYDDFAQAQKRVHRAGQTRHVTEAYVLATRQTRAGDRPTLDHTILGALQAKKSLADVVTGDRAAAAAGAI